MFEENDMSIVVEVSIESKLKDTVTIEKEQLLKSLSNSPKGGIDVL